MAQPTPYSRHYNFTNFQSLNPTTPLPADQVDIEYNAIKSTLDQILTNIAIIQRDDGQLANQIVTPDTLSTATVNLIGGFTPRGIWAASTSYAVKDAVTNSGSSYVAQVAHTSGSVFATDLTAGKWLLIAFGASSTAAAFTPTGSTPPTTGMYLPAADTIGFSSHSLPALTVTNPASPVNYWAMSGAATGNNPSLMATGSDSNVGASIITKGTGAVGLYTNSSVLQMQVAHTALAVNYLVGSGGAAGGYPYLTVAGSDTDIGLNVIAKGAGYTKFFSHSSIVQFSIAPVASAVNYLQVAGAIAAGVPSLVALGSDTNIGIQYWVKGIANHTFTADGTQGILVLAPVASGVNYFTMTANTTGAGPIISASGETNVNFNIYTKGTGAFQLYTNAGAQKQFEILHAASAVNYWSFYGAATGGTPAVQAIGSDTNVSMNLITKGTGTYTFYSNAGNNVQFQVSYTASSVNYFQVAGSGTGTGPTMAAAGSDTNVAFNVTSKGSGAINFLSNANAQQQFQVTHTASAVNYLSASGAATGSAPILQTNGSDSNRGIRIVPAGTADVQIGSAATHGMVLGAAALATNATAGFFQIPSSAGAATGAVTAAYAGAVVIHYDSTNNKIMVRSGGTWRSTAALT